MRSRSVRLTIIILLILGVALAALGFRAINIDLPGLPALERDGAGPLGLKLGLDLSGGGHLVYQADTGSRFDVTLLEPADLEDIAEALDGFRFGEEELPLQDFQVFPRDVEVVQREIATANLRKWWPKRRKRGRHPPRARRTPPARSRRRKWPRSLQSRNWSR